MHVHKIIMKKFPNENGKYGASTIRFLTPKMNKNLPEEGIKKRRNKENERQL